MGSGTGRLLAPAIVAALALAGEGGASSGGGPGKPWRPRPSGMRKAERRPWNARAMERRQRQIARGILTTANGLAEGTGNG
jgi:hypothetical protein